MVKNLKLGAGEMVQQIKAFIIKPDDTILIPGTHTVEGENGLLKAVLWPPPACHCAPVSPISKCNKKERPPGMHACNPSSWEVKVEGGRNQGYPLLSSYFETSLGYFVLTEQLKKLSEKKKFLLFCIGVLNSLNWDWIIVFQVNGVCGTSRCLRGEAGMMYTVHWFLLHPKY